MPSTSRAIAMGGATPASRLPALSDHRQLDARTEATTRTSNGRDSETPQRNEGLDEHGAPIEVRIGLSAGEPIVEDGDRFGQSVIMASRICDCAEPGQALASSVVRDDRCAGIRFEFTSIGEDTLKELEHPVAPCQLSSET